nr:hypothetical protein [Tanacetum cinerariifolium]
MSSYEVIVNGYFGMPMDPFDPYAQLVMEAPPSPDYIPMPEAPPSPNYIPGPEAPPSPDYILRLEYPYKEEEEEHLALTISTPALHSSIPASEDSDETEPFEEGETAVIVNGYFEMPMDPLDPYVQLVIEASPLPDYIPRPEAPPSPDYIPGPEAPPSPDY